MKPLFLGLFTALCFAGAGRALAGTPFAANGKLSVSGNQLVNSCGNPVQLKGVSSHGLQWFGAAGSQTVCLTSQSLDFVANTMGADIIRAAMYVNEGGYLTNQTLYRNMVNSLVTEAGNRGLYIIIDWHILNPGNPNTNIVEARAFWEYMSAQHANKDWVLYEIANEPNGVNWATIKQYHDDIIPRIRLNDPDAVIIAGTPNWSQLGAAVVADKLSASYGNIMYTFHFYAGTHATSMLTNFIGQLPIFVTEWGTGTADGAGAPNQAASQAFIDIMNTNRISWCNWSFCDKNEGSAELDPGSCAANSWDINDLTTSGGWINTWINSPADNWTACSGAASPTRTRTPTPAASRTPTPTPSRTASVTASRTASATLTRTGTPTTATSFTSTATLTRTPTGTLTRTGTPTTATSFTSTATLTRTPTGTLTRTGTPTTATSFTSTATLTRTPTGTLTRTGTPTTAITASSTVTLTRSATPTATRSSTVSGTPTATRTSSASPTASWSPTATRTITDGPTPTFTVTLTASASRTVSPSATRTATGSPTGSPTATRTGSPTGTSTPTGSPSVTLSLTVSGTPTATRTITDGPTPTYTVTATVSASRTVSPSLTATPTTSSTGSPSPTLTGSPTGTRTPTGSPSVTLSLTVSGTPTATRTITDGPTPTLTATATVSGTPSLSGTSTLTGTRTATATPSGTGTPSLTLTSTSTGTLTATLTGSVTAQASPSATVTPTALPTGSATQTPVPTVVPTQGGPLAIEEHKVWPMPLAPGKQGRLALKLLGPADEVELKLYTPAMVCVGRLQLGPAGAGWNQLALPSGASAGLAAGLYYYEVYAARGGEKVQSAKPGRIVMLR